MARIFTSVRKQVFNGVTEICVICITSDVTSYAREGPNLLDEFDFVSLRAVYFILDDGSGRFSRSDNSSTPKS